MPSIPLQRTLAISSLVYAASLWGLVWYPYRLLSEAGVGGIASSLFTYATPLLLIGWLHGRVLREARGRWLWLAAIGMTAGWTNLAYVLGGVGGARRRSGPGPAAVLSVASVDRAVRPFSAA